MSKGRVKNPLLIGLSTMEVMGEGSFGRVGEGHEVILRTFWAW